ncbi:20440_t:CDS:1, partial [Dentiscutata erythropus]
DTFKNAPTSLVLNRSVDKLPSKLSSSDNIPSKYVKVKCCDKSEDLFEYIDSNDVEFDRFVEGVDGNVFDNLSKKENSQKNKKEKEPVGSSLCSILRSYKPGIGCTKNRQK